jgi:subtilisin family serine protease
MLGGMLLSTLLALGLATAASAAEPDRDRYIVSFLDVAKGKAALRAAGARIELELAGREAAAVHIPARALNGLRNNPNIEYIEKDALRYPMAQTTPWGIPAVQADLVGDSAAGNRKICIIDSGYAPGHEDLSSGGNVNGEADTTWYEDSCFHGSHVAGTISALTNDAGVVGVLPNANVNLHIVKVFDGANCAWSYSSSLVAALDECVQAGSNVVSMSLGGGVKSRTEERAFTSAYNQGVLSVAAAGNDGNTRNSYPASYNSVISVAAVDSAGVVADFSQQNSQVELSGPGVAVRSTVGMGAGLEESLTVGGVGFEVTGMDGSAKGSATGDLHHCSGLGNPGDCAGAGGKVCVIMRGDIAFADKVLECQDNGGVAAVIVNNADALFSGTLGGVSTSIPSVGIAGVDGAALIEGSSATVTVLDGNYAFYDGTSMATPHVSGVAALLWSQDTTCSNADIRGTLAATALDLGPAGRDNAYGYGLVQVADASTALNCDGSGGGGGGGGGSCDLGQAGDSCSSDSECCSGSCKGKPGAKTCK